MKEFLTGLDWGSIAESIAVAVGTTIILWIAAVFRRQIGAGVRKSCQAVGEGAKKLVRFIRFLLSIRRHLRNFRKLIGKHREVNRTVRALRNQIAELELYSVNENAEFAEAQVKLLVTIAGYGDKSVRMAEIAEKIEWEPAYILAVLEELGKRGFIDGMVDVTGTHYYCTNAGRELLRREGRLTPYNLF